MANARADSERISDESRNHTSLPPSRDRTIDPNQKFCHHQLRIIQIQYHRKEQQPNTSYFQRCSIRVTERVTRDFRVDLLALQ